MFDKTKKIGAVLALAAATVSTPMTSYAADAISDSCACAGGAGTTASLSGANGDVLVSGPSGFSKAPRNASLPSGTQLATGSSPSGSIRLSNGCSLPIASDATIDVSSTASGGLCVSQTAGGVASSGGAGVGPLAGVGPEILVPLLVGGGVGLYFLLDDDDDAPASP